LCFLKCFDTAVWLTGKISDPEENLSLYLRTNGGRKLRGELTNQDFPGKWTLKGFWNIHTVFAGFVPDVCKDLNTPTGKNDGLDEPSLL